MTTVGAYELKTHLSALLRRAEAGERFTITHHGHPLPALGPIDGQPKRDLSEVVERIRAFGRGHSLGGLTIRELIDEGREY